ncbi:MAG: SusC/RagA family TonB-linked outer membrane protein [Cellulophaga sp.]
MNKQLFTDFFILKKSKTLVSIMTLFLFAIQLYGNRNQEKEISGKITNTNGISLVGVSIVIKGTAKGEQSNFDGNYTIKVKTGQQLIFTYIGMITVEKTVGISNIIDITMENNTEKLNEVIVLGYTTRTKNEITGSTVQVKAEEINQFQATSVDQALQGRVAGLNIATSSGTPGSSQVIRIRGYGSLNAGTEPLFVIDGVPSGAYTGGNYNYSNSGGSSLNGLTAINGDDVESITVLKDASATAAYGARGSNGVIIITTKSGKGNKKTSFNLKTTYGVRNRAIELPQMLTASQREQLLYDAVYNSYGVNNNFTREGAQAFYENRVLNNGWWGGVRRLPYQNWRDAGSPVTNWEDLVGNKDATTKTYNLSATGGTVKSSFFISLGYTDIEGTTIGSDYKRYTGRVNYATDISSKLKFSTRTNASNVIQNSLFEQGFTSNPNALPFFVSPLEHPYNEDGSYNLGFKDTAYFNVLYLAENNISKNNYTRATTNNTLEWKISDALKFKTQTNLDYNISSYQQYLNRRHGSSSSIQYTENGEQKTIRGSATRTIERDFGWSIQNSLNYKNSFGQHTFDILLLQEYQKNKYDSQTSSGQGFAINGLTEVYDTNKERQTASTWHSDWSNASYLALLNYNFDNKYVFDTTFRREGASRFSSGKRFGNFWSIGAAWNISSEKFMKNSVFSYLKVRASFGVSGNNGVGRNDYKSLLSFRADYNGESVIFARTRGNADITWEKSRTLDTGIDFGLFDGRVSGSVAYFNKFTFDQLFRRSLPPSTSFGSTRFNEGELSNKGYELELDVTAIKTKDFKWNISGNLATVKGIIEKLPIAADGNPITNDNGYTRLAVGQKIYEWYLYKWAGVDPETGDGQWFINGKDGELTSDLDKAEKAYQGTTPNPTLSGGLFTNLNYKGFFVNASFYFATGHQVIETWANYTKNNGWATLGRSFNGSAHLLKSWKKPGDITDYPKLKGNTRFPDEGNTSTRFLFDGDYIRFREAVIGYNLPKSVLDALGVRGITFTLRGTNLFTWVKDDRMEMDPEILGGLTSPLSTPPVKSFVFGANIKF